MNVDTCNLCDNDSRVLSEEGLCCLCCNLVSAEAREGLVWLGRYLAKVARYQVWCVEHGVAA